MGFPVQFHAAGVLPNLLIIVAVISVWTLARPLLSWLFGSAYFSDDDHELYVGSIDTDHGASIYAQFIDDDDDDGSLDQSWLMHSSEVTSMQHTSRHMHQHAAIAHLNELDATSFNDTQSFAAIHEHDNNNGGFLFRTPQRAFALDVDDDEDVMLPSPGCIPCPTDDSVYAEGIVEERAVYLKESEGAHHAYCCVCLCNVSPMSGKPLPCCTHVLHSNCLDAWLRHGHKKVCPLCRAPACL